MGLVISTGFFKYIPPEPKITALSTITGNLGDVITVYGEDLDYVDTLKYAEDNLNFALIGTTNALQFVVPPDPTTGQIEIFTNSFPLTGNNKLNFLPIFKFENFNPKNGSENDLLTITGKVLTSISSGFIYANPLIDDIEYIFSGEKNRFAISTNRQNPSGNEIILVQNINESGEISQHYLDFLNLFSFTSGRSTYVKYNKNTDLISKKYENHIFAFPTLTGVNIQTFKQSLNPDLYTRSLSIIGPSNPPEVFNPATTFTTFTSTGIYNRPNINSSFTGRFQQVTLNRVSAVNIINAGTGYKINDTFNFYASGTLGTDTFAELKVGSTGQNGSINQIDIFDVGIFTRTSSLTGIDFITTGIGRDAKVNINYQSYLATGINNIFYSGNIGAWILFDAILEGFSYKSPNLQSWSVVEEYISTGTSPAPVSTNLINAIDSNKTSYTISFASGYSNTGYIPFYNIISPNYYNSYISNKQTGSFDINLDSALSGEALINGLVLTTGIFNYDSGLFKVGSAIVSGIETVNSPIYYKKEPVYFFTNKLYPPYILTSFEKYLNIPINNMYINANISSLDNQKFDVNIYNPSNQMKVNYLALINSGANLSTFQYNGNNSFYKKIYLFTRDQNSFQERLELKDMNISNKNIVTFKIPETDFHINGDVEIVNYIGLSSRFPMSKFIETPKPTGVLPDKGIRGTNIMIQGKSFKKPILIDSTGEYNNCIVRFRYADNLYKQNKNIFETDFYIINKNLLSGYIPIQNFPTGRYAVQMISEDGSIFEE